MVPTSNEATQPTDEPLPIDSGAKDEDWEAAAVAAVQSFSTSMPKGWADFLAMTDDLTRLYAPVEESSVDPIVKTNDLSSES